VARADNIKRWADMLALWVNAIIWAWNPPTKDNP
jgi:hypothetical protein